MRVKTSAHLTSKLPHGVETVQKTKPAGSRPRGQLLKLPYIILENHISKTEALHLLGRVVGDVRRPLEHYVPSRTSTFTSPHTLHATGTTASDLSGTTLSGTTLNAGYAMTAQDTYPDSDPALFVLPNLPLSVAESTSATLSETSNYSSKTQSLLSALLGVSFSLKRTVSKTFTLNAKVLRVLSLNQHSEVFSRLMGLYGEEVKVALKKAGGTMFFVVGVKLSTDATVETREEGQKSTAGNVILNASQVTGLGTQGTAGIELGQVLTGHSVQKTLNSTTMEDIKGERAFAMEYCCVQLRRRLEFVPDSRHPRRLEDTVSFPETYSYPSGEGLNRAESPPMEDQPPSTSTYKRRRRLPQRVLPFDSPEELGSSEVVSESEPEGRHIPCYRRDSPPIALDCSEIVPEVVSEVVRHHHPSQHHRAPSHTVEPTIDDRTSSNDLEEPSDSNFSPLCDLADVTDASDDWETEGDEESIDSDCNFPGEGYDEFEVVLDDKLYIESFDCLG